MSSAVEVLREMAETEYEESKALIAAGWEKAGNYHLKKSNALKEACLALENQRLLETELKLIRKQMLDYENKLNRLEKWLDNRIKKNQERLDWQKKRLDEPFSQQIADAIEQRIVDYKEVRSVLEK